MSGSALSGNRLLVPGLLLAATPTGLFFPALAFLTVCPPSYGPAVMKGLAVAFCISWGFAIVLLIKWRLLGSDSLTAATLAWVGIAVSVSGIAFTVWLLAKTPTR